MAGRLGNEAREPVQPVAAAGGVAGGAPHGGVAPVGAGAGQAGGEPDAAGGGVPVSSVDDVRQDHDIRAVLRITAFRRLWLCLGLSSFGDWLGLLALASFAGTLAGDSYAATGFAVSGVFLLRLLPAVVLGPVAGVVADRLDRKTVLVVGDLLRFALFASIPLVGTLTWVFVATVLIECVALFWLPAKDASVPNLVPRERLEAANQVSLVTTYGTAPLAAGAFVLLALLSGVLDNVLPLPPDAPELLALWVNAATFLVGALVIARLEIPAGGARTGAGRREPVWRTVVEGWRFVGSTPAVRGLVIGMLGAFAAAGFVIGLATLFVADLGAGEPGFGVLFGAVFVGLALGMWTGPRLLVGLSRRRLFGLSLVAAGAALVLLALQGDIVLATLLTVALGACGGVAWVTGYTLLGLDVDDEVRGRTFAFLQSTSRVVLALVLAVAPAVAALLGTHDFSPTPDRTFTYNGAAITFLLAGIVTTAVGVLAFRQMDDRPGVPLREDLARAWRERRSHAVGDSPGRRPGAGYFLVLEGGDGAGKSTQAGEVARWLRDDLGHDVVLTREPGATRVGARLREVLLHGEDLGERAEALLFAADRAHHVHAVVRPALERGAVVVCDRYVDSSAAYQGAGRGLPVEEVLALSRWATEGLVPDLTVLLDVEPALSRTRLASEGGLDRIESAPDDFHARVRHTFLDLAGRDPRRYLVLDGAEPPEVVADAIRDRLREILPESARHRAERAAREEAERRTAEERARQEAEERTRREAEDRARREAEERARLEAEDRARREAEDRARREAEEGARREAEERARREAEERARLEAAERQRAEEERMRRAAKERRRVEAQQRAAAERERAAAERERAAAERERVAAAARRAADSPTERLTPVAPAPEGSGAPAEDDVTSTRPLDLSEEIFGGFGSDRGRDRR